MSAAEPAPLVSIVVPVFNGERFLRESLDSIVNQSYRQVEILVMDDASTDTTPEIVASYGEAIRYHRQQQTRGIYGNANDGICLARGEFIAVYHADDVYDPRIVEHEVRFLVQHPEAGAAFCEEIFIDTVGREFGRLNLPREVQGGQPLPYPVIFNALLKYKNRFLCCPTAMVRASVHREVGVYRDETFRNTSDLDMWLRIARTYPIGILEEHLLRYRRGHGSSSERYHRLRTDPERFFTIMDLYLADGDRDLATSEALTSYEAHRAEDQLKIASSLYILGQRPAAAKVLNQVRVQRILGGSQVRRERLLVLYLVLAGLVRVPRISLAADALYRRIFLAGRAGDVRTLAPGGSRGGP